MTVEKNSSQNEVVVVSVERTGVSRCVYAQTMYLEPHQRFRLTKNENLELARSALSVMAS
jgi:hypothetical protein